MTEILCNFRTDDDLYALLEIPRRSNLQLFKAYVARFQAIAIVALLVGGIGMALDRDGGHKAGRAVPATTSAYQPCSVSPP